MARQLWVLRHAEAEPHGTRADAERRLTARGEGQARTAGLALRRLGARFDTVLFSPKARAQATAELAAAEWNGAQQKLLRAYPPLAGGFDAQGAIEAASEVGPDGRLLIVGHEPDLSEVVDALTGARVEIKKGGLAVVRLQGAGGELAALLRPRELALIAGGPADGD